RFTKYIRSGCAAEKFRLISPAAIDTRGHRSLARGRCRQKTKESLRVDPSLRQPSFRMTTKNLPRCHPERQRRISAKRWISFCLLSTPSQVQGEVIKVPVPVAQISYLRNIRSIRPRPH